MLLSRDHSDGLIENCGRKAYQGIDMLTEPLGNAYIRFCIITYIVQRKFHDDITERMLTSQEFANWV